MSNVGGMAVDLSGNVYFADILNDAIRFINQQTGIITTIAGMVNGTWGAGGDGFAASSATLNYPGGLSLDTTNNLLYIADSDNNKIRMVTLSTGIITTYAGTGDFGSSGDGGAAIDAQLAYPQSVVTAANNVYIVDTFNNKIRKVDQAGVITTYAGTGIVGSSGDGIQATSAALNYPQGVAVDRFGNVYIADTYNHFIRVVNSTGIITTFAGIGIYTPGFNDDGVLAKSAHVNYPRDLAVDANGNVFIADSNNYVVYLIANGTGIINIYAGNGISEFSGDGGPATSASLSSPVALAVDVSGMVYIGDASRVRKVVSVSASHQPTSQPTNQPTSSPLRPTKSPTVSPTREPTRFPTTFKPTQEPTRHPTEWNPYVVR